MVLSAALLALLFSIDVFYLKKEKLRNKHIEFVEIKDYLDDIVDLQNDADNSERSDKSGVYV
ncbi:MAG: hypothetical protein IPP60_13405 [Sphingobacteriales bacterium]|nr:hypothetical protein [Sphingobacteriales bacterium]